MVYILLHMIAIPTLDGVISHHKHQFATMEYTDGKHGFYHLPRYSYSILFSDWLFNILAVPVS